MTPNNNNPMLTQALSGIIFVIFGTFFGCFLCILWDLQKVTCIRPLYTVPEEHPFCSYLGLEELVSINYLNLFFVFFVFFLIENQIVHFGI